MVMVLWFLPQLTDKTRGNATRGQHQNWNLQLSTSSLTLGYMVQLKLFSSLSVDDNQVKVGCFGMWNGLSEVLPWLLKYMWTEFVECANCFACGSGDGLDWWMLRCCLGCLFSLGL